MVGAVDLKGFLLVAAWAEALFIVGMVWSSCVFWDDVIDFKEAWV